jgi:F-type H+-transporting ATPase subunit b
VLLDWFTIIAQIINFLILLYLLRRFLYRPILDTMQAREDRIAALLEEAELKRKEAEQERQHFEMKNQEFQENYDQRQREMELSLDDWRKDAYRAARKEVDDTLNDWYKTVEEDKETFITSLNQFAVRQTYSIARRAIGDLGGVDLESQLVRTFLDNLKRQQLDFDNLSNGSGHDENSLLKLRSAFDLPAALQEQLLERLQSHFGKKINLQFETVPSLISGIELVWDSGYTAAWNLRRYLETLQDDLDQQVNSYIGEKSFTPQKLEV